MPREASARPDPVSAGERRFRIRNLAKDVVLCEAACLADTFWMRAKGLMLQKGWENFDGLLLSPCRSIHTFGMRMRIDVCFLDRGCRITKSLGSLGPWRSAHGGRHSHATLELPAGALERTGTGAGDRLVLETETSKNRPAGADEVRAC